ncbi:MAG TPA: gamma-glutamyltransferase [Thermoanaerobaculia bacterium]|nr:gamma-glutamyltransferase [Thermoanaerobaculia bacterium]
MFTRPPALFSSLLLLSLAACQSRAPVAMTPTPAPLPAEAALPPAGDGPAVGTHGMVASAHPLATRAGLDVLRAGGNAFDAAVAVAAMLNVVEPESSGIGGYGTILVYDAKSGKPWFLDSSGRIPAGVDSDAFRAPTPGYLENRQGAKAVSTPGNLHAWEAMRGRYGTRPLAELLAPAIRTAEEGFPVSPWVAVAIADSWDRLAEGARAFYGRDGKPLAAGETLVQKDLARTLRQVAGHGPDAFYKGETGRAIDAEMKARGGFLALSDLAADRSEWWEPIHLSYRGHEVMTTPPPSNAFPALIRLGILSRFDVAKMGHDSADYLHLFAEVTKRGFWCRLAYAGDPEIQPPPLGKLLSPAWLDAEARAVDLQHAKPFVPPGNPGTQGSNTTHFVVADHWGNVVSATQTLGNVFGSGLMPAGTGVWLNDSLAYCTFEPKGNPMDAHAGRRKLSGDCPMFVLKNGKPWIALGTPGGHTIDQTVPQMVMNLLDFGMDVRQAIAAPRISFVEPDVLAVEKSIPEAVRTELAARGHKLRVVRGLGNAHGLTVEYDATGRPVRFTGAADPRGEGLAAGY